jgi:hypothetical protein
MRTKQLFFFFLATSIIGLLSISFAGAFPLIDPGSGGGGGSTFFYTVSGTVTKTQGCGSIQGHQISISGGGMSGSDTIDSNGYYYIRVTRSYSGTVTFSVDVDGFYVSSGGSVTVQTNQHVSHGVDVWGSINVGVQACPGIN